MKKHKLRELNKTVGLNVKRLRKRHNFTQYEVAKRLGIHQTALSRVENGTQALNAAQLLICTEVFNVNFESFYSD